MADSWDSLKILSDSTRLRVLALLLKEELSVAELQEILGMAQSRISSQLALPRQAGFVQDRREGKKAFYSLRPNLSPRRLALVKAACESVVDLPESVEDRENLDRILQKRRRVSEQYFNLIAGRLGGEAVVPTESPGRPMRRDTPQEIPRLALPHQYIKRACPSSVRRPHSAPAPPAHERAFRISARAASGCLSCGRLRFPTSRGTAPDILSRAAPLQPELERRRDDRRDTRD